MGNRVGGACSVGNTYRRAFSPGCVYGHSVQSCALVRERAGRLSRFQNRARGANSQNENPGETNDPPGTRTVNPRFFRSQRVVRACILTSPRCVPLARRTYSESFGGLITQDARRTRY